MEASEQQARAIQDHKNSFERQIETMLREFEASHEGPLAVEMTFAEDQPGGTAPEGIKSRIETAVETFHRLPAIDRSGIRVQKLTAMDSDADGTIAVEVEYDYPGYA